ncbi:MAG: beta-lactamase family protein [Bacteroidales bacterium]|nr:beta-lactamase family protein [Bacteroidales bacterium]
MTEFEAFANGVFETILAEKHIAGATFSVVHKGEVMIRKGYGFANVDQNLSVNPETTLFRIGSISKLFVWIGVMQMVEQGKLDLDRDINEYLQAFKIPDTYDQPVTLRSLMTHTPGFEDKLYQLFVLDENDMKPLAEVLKEQLPKRVRPPLQQASYSNHGTGIAQHLVELASEMPFVEYAERFIFDPLGMQHTTIRQPVPAAMATNLSLGYAYKDGRFIEKPFELIPLQSIGSASTTASDMARFMNALLNNTCLEGHCLLDSATYALMTKPAFSHATGTNPALLGFMDVSFNGHRIFGHGGSTFLFHSLMVILPEDSTGIFYSFNSEAGSGVSMKTIEYLGEYLFPDTRPLAETIELNADYLEDFEGTYRMNRFSHTEFFKVLSLAMSAKVSQENGMLRMDAMGETTWWMPVDSLTFREERSNQLIVFSRDKKGKVDNIFLGQLAIFAFNKNRGFWTPQLHAILFALLIFVILYILVVWPGIFFLRRKYVPADRAPATLPLGSKVIAWITAACYLLFFIFFATGTPPGQDLVFGVTPGIKTALFFPLLAIPFTILMIWQSITLLDEHNTRFRSRLFYWLSTLVFMAVIWQFHFWNLLGWRY